MKANVLKKGNRTLEARLHTEPARIQYAKKCLECGEQMTPSRQNYQYTECGLSSVVLKGILVYNCRCGAIVPEIPAVSGLHLLITAHVLLKDSLLSAEEIRFLRKMAGYSAVDLANTIAVTKVSLSRWENGRRVQRSADRLIRLACFTKMIEDAAKEAGVESADGMATKIVEFARRVSSFNLTEFLKTIKNEMGGSKPIRIDLEASQVPPFSDFFCSGTNTIQ